MLLTVIYALGMLSVVSACGGEHKGHDEHADAAQHHDDDHDDHDDAEEGGHSHAPGTIIMQPRQAEAAGVEVRQVVRGDFNDVIQASGKITAASCDETTIVATSAGIVTHARHISEGMPIAGGTTLFHVASDRLQDGDMAQRARIAYLAAKRDYDRALPLLNDRLITDREFSSIKADYETARVAYEAVSGNMDRKGVTIKATAGGYVARCMVSDGDYVEVGTPMMTITKNKHLYLRAEAPVRYYSQLSKIRTAKFRSQYSDQIIDLQQMNGHIMSLGKSTEVTTSYIPVTFQFDNNGSIIPGAYAEVFLITGTRHGVLSVPTSALTEEQGVYYVYCRTDDHSYHKQEVTLGATDGENTEIKTGLKGGEHVVVKGAINVKLAGASSAIPAHNHNH